MAFSCFKVGAQNHDPSAFTWEVSGDAVVDAVPAATGEVVNIGLTLDGAALGEGPFLKNADDQFSTSLPRNLPLLDAMQNAETLVLSIGETPASFPMAGLEAALAELTKWCATEDTEATAPQVVSTLSICENPDTATAQTICSLEALTSLERAMSEALVAQLSSLDERAAKALRSEQAGWTSFRENCSNDAACIETATKARLARLQPPQEKPPAPASTAIAAKPEPAPLPVLGAPITPLQPAQLSSVIWNQKQVQIKLILEAVRSNSSLTEDQNILRNWARLALDQNGSQAGWDQVARSHLIRSIEANPPGPFLIGHLLNSPLRNNSYENGLFTVNNNIDAQVRRLGVQLSGVGQIEIRARSQLNTRQLPATKQQADYMNSRSNMLQMGVVYQIDEVSGFGQQYGAAGFVARAQVRFAGIFERSQKNNVPFNPQSLLAIFANETEAAPATGLVGAAEVLDIPLLDGKVFDNGSTQSGSGAAGKVNTLVSWAALRQKTPDVLTDELRRLAFFTLATQRERDAVIDPVYLASSRDKNFAFDRSVDEFERAELIDAVDNTLWPVVRQRLPNVPIDVIATRQVYVGEYDRSLGGFPLQVSGGAFNIARQGRFPALREIPDFLPVSIEDARQLVAYMESIGQPTDRRLAMVFQYRITNVDRVEWAQNRGRQQDTAPTIEPIALSLHGYKNLEPGQSPLAQKIMDFDLAVFRGPERPVADPSRVAFWEGVFATSSSTMDDLAYAAMGVADGSGVANKLAEEAVQVRRVNDFEKPTAIQSVLAQLETAPKPKSLKLEGEIQFAGYDQQTGTFLVDGFSFRAPQGEQWSYPPRIVLSDPSILARIEADQSTAALFFAAERYQTISAGMTVWARPDLASYDGRNVQLFISPSRIVLRAGGDDGTGYPPAYIDLKPAMQEAAQPGDAAASVATGAPSEVALDSDYLDLLMVRDTPDTISETTYLRMMHDRRLREARARDLGMPLEWGWFFTNPTAQMNPVQERSELARFKDWTAARAAALPETVYLQSPGLSGPGNLSCFTAVRLQPNILEQAFPSGLPGNLTVEGYNRHSIMLNAFSRNSGQGMQVWPLDYRVIVGTPSLSVTRTAATDSANSACGRQTRNQRQPLTLDGAIHQNALIEVRNAIRKPLPREPRLIFRDFGTVSVESADARGLKLRFDVTRSSVFAVTESNPGTALTLQEALTSESLPLPPEALDIFDIAPGEDWSSARAKAASRLPEAIVLEENGPPSGLRVITQNTVFGEEQQFQALRNGHFLIDVTKNEAIALLRENERDPDRLIGVGSYRTFDATTTSPDALIGALLRKYGKDPVIGEDGRFYGPRPAQTLTWGARTGCLPRMDDEIRPSLNDKSGLPEYQVLSNTARQFRAPQLQYTDQAQMMFEGCGPTVWAIVGEDSQKQLRMIVWSLDLSIMNEVAQMPDLATKADGDEGSQTLIDNAADIDL
ncbi:MAG: hypothetical protein AAF718_05070 [Pseudomonadota bacterium]